MASWAFADPDTTPVIVDRTIFERNAWIAAVSHDVDGAWQFLSGDDKPRSQSDAMVVGLGEVLAKDSSIAELADLPLGWMAWRQAHFKPWQRKARS